jgi:dUTP pyrophosphatase
MIVKVKPLPDLKELPLPEYAKPGDSCRDLRACIDGKITIKPMEVVKIPTGIALELPLGYEAQVRPRSGWSLKGVLIHWGTCDFPYRGEVCAVFHNLSKDDIVIQRGDRIAQLAIAEAIHYELEIVDELQETTRGSAGFGSSGIK